jgi:hypothetical protein
MDALNSYSVVARAYVEEVRALLTQTGAATAERGAGGPASSVEVAERGERLLDLSTALQDAVTQKLTDDDPEISAQGATQLLAKAYSDLDVSLYLLQAATDEETGVAMSGAASTLQRSGVERGAGNRELGEHLQILLGESAADDVADERSAARSPRRIEEARVKILDTIELTLFQISERAGAAGQATFSGLLAMGFVELGQVAGAVGANVAQYFGVAEKVTRLYDLFRGFLSKAYDSIISLLGPRLAQSTTGAVLQWWEDWKESRLFPILIERLYATGQTKVYLATKVHTSQAGLDSFISTIERLEAMDKEYGQQVRIAEKLLRGLKYASGVTAAILPYGSLIAGAAYVALCGYIVLAGADYVDAESISILKRVPGVRDVVEANL